MTIRSVAAAVLCAGLPAAAAAQPSPAPRPAPTVVVERAGAVTPASGVARTDPPQKLLAIPDVPPPTALPTPQPMPAPTPAPLPAPKAVPAPKVSPASVDIPAKPEPIVVEAPRPATLVIRLEDPPARYRSDECAWGQFEWLYWAGSGQSTPPLVTVSPPGTVRGAAGVLGESTTITQFGGTRRNNDFRDGFRYTGGWWCDTDRTRGIEADFFFLARSREAGAAASDGSGVIARPYFDAAANLPAADLVSFPGVAAGSVTAEATSRVIGGGLSSVHNVCAGPCSRVDLLLGVRYLHLGDQVNVTQSVTALGDGGRVPAGGTLAATDHFATTNDFYGGVIGLSGERRLGAFFVGGRVSVALGGVVQTTTVDGRTVLNGVAQTGGLLAQPTNVGEYRRSTFAVVPEAGLRAGFQLTETARVYGGYNFLYLSDVARAGDQIDPAVNPLLLPPRAGVAGPGVPAYPGRTTDFWLQGVSMGVELRF